LTAADKFAVGVDREIEEQRIDRKLREVFDGINVCADTNIFRDYFLAA
jgi:hypothetical protein